jgi:AraC family cel operon transcriptional repressor
MIHKLDASQFAPGHGCTYVVWEYKVYAESPWLHTHTFHEFFWVIEGRGLHHINGEVRPLSRGMLVFVRADDVHSLSAAADSPLRFVNFAFPADYWTRFKRQTPELPAHALFFDERDHAKREFALDPLRLERIRMMSEDLTAGARDSLTVAAFLGGVVGMMANAIAQETDGVPAWLREACVLIREPKHCVGGTREFARLSGYSEGHLARAVRKHLGCTPRDIVNEARLAEAARQLVATPRTVLAIAADCGFENAGHFYKLFNARFGTSPHRFRERAAPSPETQHDLWARRR